MNAFTKTLATVVLTTAIGAPVTWVWAQKSNVEAINALSQTFGKALNEVSVKVDRNTQSLAELRKDVDEKLPASLFTTYIAAHDRWSERVLKELEAGILSVKQSADESRALSQKNNDALKRIEGIMSVRKP